MTLEESIRQQQQIISNMQRTCDLFAQQLKAVSLAVEPYRIVQERLAFSLDRMAQSVAAVTRSYGTSFENVNAFMLRFQRDIASVTGIESASLFSQMSAAIQQFSICTEQTDSPIPFSSELAADVSSAVAAAQPYLPPKQQKECEEVLLPPLTAPKAKRFSAESMVRLIEFLLSLIVFICSQLPDPQLERIIAQNDHLIAIEEEHLELQRRQADALDALKDIAEDLTGAVERLCEQLEAQAQQPEILADKAEGVNHSEILPNQGRDAGGLEQEANAKN